MYVCLYAYICVCAPVAYNSRFRRLISRTCLSRCAQLAPPRKRAMHPSVLCRRGENTTARRTLRTLSFRDEIRIRLLGTLQRYHRIRLMSRGIICTMNLQYFRMILCESPAISKAKQIIADFPITGGDFLIFSSIANVKI